MENRTARQVLFVAAMMGVSSLSVGQELASAASYADPASVQVQQMAPAQLADLVAPVALYPDSLLSQVLVASTYPLDVVQAQQWLARNGHLQGQALMDAARQQPWDASVQGLVAFPDALSTLNDDVQWTTSLGNAFLSQEADVMAAVQDLRARAQSAGRLSSDTHQTVSVVPEEGRTIIEIVPADPQVIYVPAYDPYYVWGAPAWSAYPRLSYGYGYGYGRPIDVGYWFGGWSWGWGWGWGPNWYGGSIWVDSAFFRHCGYNYGRHRPYYGGRYAGRGDWHGRGERGGRETWRHDTGNRKGVPYSTGRGGSEGRRGSQASRSTLFGPESSRRAGTLATSPSGNRAISPGSRTSGRDGGWRSGDGVTSSGRRTVTDQGRRTVTDQGRRAVTDQGRRTVTDQGRRTVTDQGWRTGSGTVAPRTRGEGADRGWSSSGEQRRSSRGVSQGQGPSVRTSDPSPRYSAPSPRSSGSSSGYSAPSPRSSGSSSRYSAPSPRSSGSSSRYSAPSPRSSGSSSRYSAPSPRSSGSSSGYSVPSRSSSPGSQARGYQAAPRSSSSTGAGRSHAGGTSRGSAGGRGSSGGSGGGDRRH